MDFQTSDEGNIPGTATSDIPLEILLDTQKSVKRVEKRFDKMEKNMKDLKKENEDLKKQMINWLIALVHSSAKWMS